MTVANEFKVDVIVMEHLDLAGRKRGSKRQRLHHWRAKYVQQIVEHQAHRCGTRIRRVCSWNTSKLAFDGTGDVTRDTDNYSMCTFQTGKRYSCDLSASYNIGARYFLREYEKSISATRWRCIAAKVPSCAKRITRTLDTLFGLTRSCAPCERRFLSLPAICAQAVLAGKRQGSPVQLIIGWGGFTDSDGFRRRNEQRDPCPSGFGSLPFCGLRPCQAVLMPASFCRRSARALRRRIRRQLPA